MILILLVKWIFFLIHEVTRLAGHGIYLNLFFILIWENSYALFLISKQIRLQHLKHFEKFVTDRPTNK